MIFPRPVIFIYLDVTHLPNDLNKKHNKENHKNSIKSKLYSYNNAKSLNNTRVLDLVKDYKDNEKIDNLFNSELESQGKSFKERLEKKRNKSQLSTSDIADKDENKVNSYNLEEHASS